MKKLLSIISVAVVALALSACNIKIDNPKASNFVGTWDLQSTEIVTPDGSVTKSVPNTLDYIVFSKSQVSFYEADKLSREGSFAVKDNVIYVNGTAAYKVASLTGREMTLTQSGIGILVSEYRYNYKKR